MGVRIQKSIISQILRFSMRINFLFIFGVISVLQFEGCNANPSQLQDNSNSSSEEELGMPVQEAINVNHQASNPTSSKIELWNSVIEAEESRVVDEKTITSLKNFRKIFFGTPIHYSVDGNSIYRISEYSRKKNDKFDFIRSNEVVVYDTKSWSLREIWESEVSGRKFECLFSRLSLDGSTLGVVWESEEEHFFEFWDTKQGKVRSKFTRKKNIGSVFDDCPKGRMNHFEISPQGDMAITNICQENIECWNTLSGKTLWEMEVQESESTDDYPVAFSPVQNIIAIWNGRVEFRDLSSGKLTHYTHVNFPKRLKYYSTGLTYTKEGDLLIEVFPIPLNDGDYSSLSRFALIEKNTYKKLWESSNNIHILNPILFMGNNTHFVVSGRVRRDSDIRVEFRRLDNGKLDSAFLFNIGDEPSHEAYIAVHPDDQHIIVEAWDTHEFYEIPELSVEPFE